MATEPAGPRATISVELTRAEALTLTGWDWQALRYEFPDVKPDIVVEARSKLWTAMRDVGWDILPTEEPYEPCENLSCQEVDCEVERRRRGLHATWVMQLWGSLARTPGDSYRAHCCCGWSGKETRDLTAAFADCRDHAPEAPTHPEPLLPNARLVEGSPRRM